MHAELLLGPDPGSPRHARSFASRQLQSWGRHEWDLPVGLLVSELVTNAVLHARTSMSLRLVLLPDAVRIELRDGSPRGPVRRSYGPDATTGRGLGLVSALSRDWGVDKDPTGKTVWCEVAGVEWDVEGLFDLEGIGEEPRRSRPIDGGSGGVRARARSATVA